MLWEWVGALVRFKPVQFLKPVRHSCVTGLPRGRDGVCTSGWDLRLFKMQTQAGSAGESSSCWCFPTLNCCIPLSGKALLHVHTKINQGIALG